MKKLNAQGIIEFTLIALLVATLVFVASRNMTGNYKRWAGLSDVKMRDAATEQAKDSVEKNLSNLSNDKNNSQLKIETAGTLGQLIAKYKETNDQNLKDFLTKELKSFAMLDNKNLSDAETDACISSPESCSVLNVASPKGSPTPPGNPVPPVGIGED